MTKGVANVPWPGNRDSQSGRDLRSGMLNAIGLQNPGIDVFCKERYSRSFRNMIRRSSSMSAVMHREEDYCAVVERLAEETIDMMEINVSCPNVKAGGLAFGQDPKARGGSLRAEVKKMRKAAGNHEAESRT